MARPQSGHDAVNTYLPGDDLRLDESVGVEFDWADPEPATRNYPGSPGGIWITHITRLDGVELDVDDLSPELLEHFVEEAAAYLEDRRARTLER